MNNREIYQRDPDSIALLNNGVAAVTDVLTDEERLTLRFELEHFVCEGEYQRGLVRILESYTTNIGQPEQPAAWVSGFFGSGKSHLVKMLRYLWVDYTFLEDGATARGLARLPDDVLDLLKEMSTLGKRYGGLRAAAGTLGSGSGESVRLALLGIVFKSAELPESYPQARFCLWLKKNGMYDQVCAEVEEAGRDFRRELNDLYVSPLIAKALLAADPAFAADEREAKTSLRAQFPKPKDITNDEFVGAMQDVLAPAGMEMPCTVVILDEVQQYIGEDTARSYVVQEVVEACSKRFGDRLLFVGTGQTALSGTPALQRLQGRFTVNVELSDHDVETVTRRVVLAKRPDRITAVKSVLEANSGEIDRQLTGTKIGPRTEDKAVVVDDYPLLPVRRRFWEHVLRAVDKAGTAGQLRTQLRIVYDAIRQTADAPLGTVVPADFLFDELAANLLQSGVLLREIHEIIRRQDDGTEDGKLRSRMCALVFLIRKIPRDPGVDIGVRATAETLSDLLVSDLAGRSSALRAKVPQLLDALVQTGTLIKVDNEFSLQTRESSEWEQEFRNRRDTLSNDTARMGSKRGQHLTGAVQVAVGSLKLTHGKCKEPRKLSLYFGSEAPAPTGHDIPVWIRDEWSTEAKSVVADARAAGPDSPVISVFIPKAQSDSLRKAIAEETAAKETLDFKGVPGTKEGEEAQEAMRTRLLEAERTRKTLIASVIDGAKVIQGGGNERFETTLVEKIQATAEASLDRLFHEFAQADHKNWPKVIERAREGAEHPLEAIDFNGKTEDHSVCSAVRSFIGSGKKGKDVRAHFSEAPYGWPRDAVDAALISLFAGGHLRAASGGVALQPRGLDQAKVSQTDFRVESATVTTHQRLALRKLYQQAGIPCKPNEEGAAAAPLLDRLLELASGAGGEPPLPQRPGTGHLTELRSLAGNEQLLAIVEKQADLTANLEQWTKARALAEKRLPAFQRLSAFMGHAEGQVFGGEIQPQYDAVLSERSLLDESDPVPNLTKALVDGLRQEVTARHAVYEKTFDAEMAALEGAECWQKIKEGDRVAILARVGVTKLDKGALGADQQVLESLDRIPLDGWVTKTQALP
ncbi:MAG: BREX system P-loop protein BrxC [Nitrospirota bacterium]|nr:BREX system P-loop protein BrxC [Nitrospirota bacterium]